MKQLQHTEIKNEQRSFPITIICDAIRTPENIGMCFRISESFGVSKIYLHGTSPGPENRIVQRTARNTLKAIPFEKYEDFSTLVSELKASGHRIIALEVTDQSVPLNTFDFSLHENIVLLVGSERHGIQDISLVDDSVAIPMYGKNSSINVIHSLSIALYEITNQYKTIPI